MKTIALIILASIWGHSQNIEDMLWEPAQKNGLPKGSATMATSYSSSSANLNFTAPTGWGFQTADVTEYASGVQINGISNPLYPNASISIFSYRYPTDHQAQRNQYSLNFISQKVMFVMGSTSAPLLYSITDTTLGQFKFVLSKTKQLDVNLIYVVWTVSNASSMISCYYVTSIADYNANNTNYSLVWNNAQFYSTTSLSKGPQNLIRRPEFHHVNALGQTLGEKETRVPQIKVPR